MKIVDAGKEDASLIADAIMEAVGEEIVAGLAGEKNSRDDIHDIFRRLAEREDSQYSYLNTRIARDSVGEAMGVCVSYDGADLVRLRRSFFAQANDVLGWGLSEQEIEEIPGETSDGEFYLDTLMTLPRFRGQGVGRSLIEDAKSKADRVHKPLGLLCDVGNTVARKLYDSVGFKEKGTRPFAGHVMNHLQL